MCGCRITPQIGMRGTFLPITKTINSIIFRPISVTYEQNLMPIKYNACVINKLNSTVF